MNVLSVTSCILIGLCAVVRLTSSQECLPGFFTCDNGRCLWPIYICDGEDNCGDNSDEVDQSTGTCPLCPGDYFQCLDDGHCVEKDYICDGQMDCLDGSDEFGPEKCPPCMDGEFACDNGNCIPDPFGSIVCDGTNHCGDWSDEPDDCPPCREHQWECTNGNCVSLDYICNGRDDCMDNSDELDPLTGACPLCPDHYFQCLNGKCKPAWDVCNGFNDCGDMSDEPNDPEECPPCDDGQYRCKSGMCITGSLVCNGENNCKDWSDEIDEACPCQDNEIRCKVPPNEEHLQPGLCIPPEWICDVDGIRDCPLGDDEANCTLPTSHHKRHNNSRREEHIAHHLKNKRAAEHKIKLAVEFRESVKKAHVGKKSQLYERIFMRQHPKQKHN